MLKEIRPAIVLVVILTLITGLVYPAGDDRDRRSDLPDAGAGQPGRGRRQGRRLGADRYRSSRATSISMAGSRPPRHRTPNDSTKTVPAPYNAANSGGSNLGPTNKALIDRVKADVDKLKAENPSAPVPIDLVTTTGGGLDPHITPEAAMFQVPRVAKARNLPEDRVRELVNAHVEGRLLGLLGEPRVNVLALNMALDGVE